MANLYLIDMPFGPNGLELAKADAGARVVLIQDGVYLDASAVAKAGGKVYAVKKDVEKRGIGARLAGSVELVDYAGLVDLIVDNKVINFT